MSAGQPIPPCESAPAGLTVGQVIYSLWATLLIVEVARWPAIGVPHQ